MLLPPQKPLCSSILTFSVLGNTCDDGTIEFPYTGNVSITNNGRKCQKWSDQTPHPHDFAEDFYEGPQGEIIDTTSNYCRQPDSDSTPWCYTLDPRVRWGYCDISICTGTVTVARKSVFGVSEQQRHRPACASAQTYQRLVIRYFGQCRITCYKRNFNFLACLCS